MHAVADPELGDERVDPGPVAFAGMATDDQARDARRLRDGTNEHVDAFPRIQVTGVRRDCAGSVGGWPGRLKNRQPGAAPSGTTNTFGRGP